MYSHSRHGRILHHCSMTGMSKQCHHSSLPSLYNTACQNAGNRIFKDLSSKIFREACPRTTLHNFVFLSYFKDLSAFGGRVSPRFPCNYTEEGGKFFVELFLNKLNTNPPLVVINEQSLNAIKIYGPIFFL